VDEVSAFFVGQLAFWIEEGLSLSAGLEAGIAILLVAESFAAYAGQDGQKAEESGGQILKVCGEAASLEALQEFEDAHGSHVKADLVEPGGFGVIEEFQAVGLAITKIFAPLLMVEPVLVTAGFPAREVLLFKMEGGGLGVGSEGFEDVLVGCAVVEQVVDLIADELGQAGELAAAVGSDLAVGFGRFGRGHR